MHCGWVWQIIQYGRQKWVLFPECIIHPHQGLIWHWDIYISYKDQVIKISRRHGGKEYRTAGYFRIKIGIEWAMACLAARNHILEPTPTKSCENEKQITLSGQFWSAGSFLRILQYCSPRRSSWWCLSINHLCSECILSRARKCCIQKPFFAN